MGVNGGCERQDVVLLTTSNDRSYMFLILFPSFILLRYKYLFLIYDFPVSLSYHCVSGRLLRSLYWVSLSLSIHCYYLTFPLSLSLSLSFSYNRIAVLARPRLTVPTNPKCSYFPLSFSLFSTCLLYYMASASIPMNSSKK